MTRGPVIHGALLLAALAFAYQTWTRDDTPAVDRGEFTLWEQAEGSFKSLTYEADKKTVRLERRTDDGQAYLWATVTREVERPKPVEPAGDKPETSDKPETGDETKAKDGKKASDDDKAEAGDDKKASEDDTKKPGDGDKAEAGDDDKRASDADKASEGDADKKPGDGDKAEAGDDDKASEGDADKETPKKPEMIVETRVEEFPVGETGKQLIKAVAPLMALRDLGTPPGKELDTYGLAEPKMTVTVEFDGATRSLQIGGRVYGGSDRYVRDPDSGRTYVIDGSKLRVLEGGDAALRDNRLIAASADDVASAAVIVGDTRRAAVRVSVPASAQGRARVFWASEGQPEQEDPTLTNFMSRVEKLVPLDFESDIDASEFVEMAKFEYRDEGNEVIDTVVVYRAPGKTEDKPEYYARSRHTRILARLNRPLTAQIDEDLSQITETAE